MAAKEMYDYLPTVSPDISSTTLTVIAQNDIVEISDKRQSINEGDDASVEVITLSGTTPIFQVQIQWDDITESDMGTIFDFWNDPAKGNGRENTFAWTHPDDNHNYVVRFETNMSRIFGIESKSVKKITLRIEGKIAD